MKTFKEYLNTPSSRDELVILEEGDYKLGATVGRITQLFIKSLNWSYVIQEGSDIVWVPGNDGNPKNESVFRIGEGGLREMRFFKLFRECSDLKVFRNNGNFYKGSGAEAVQEFIKANPEPADFHVWLQDNYEPFIWEF